MRLTTTMRETLRAARRQELRRTDQWPAPWQTLNALVRHGLLTTTNRRNRHGHELRVWTITQAGREALQPREIFRHESVVYLGRAVPATAPGITAHGEFTTNPRYALCGERVPIIDPDTLDHAWTQLSEERQAAAADRRARARQLAKNTRAA